MNQEFKDHELFAHSLDQDDPLKDYRKRFFIPSNTIYFDGNSLGLHSQDAQQVLTEVVATWQNNAIDGWTQGDNPWFFLSEQIGALCAPLVGAKNDEVIITGGTTINIHSIMSTFYNPTGKRTKILADSLTFPSDIYALEGQIESHGLDPHKHLVLVSGDENGFLNEETIIDQMNDEIAIVWLPSVLYRSGQLLHMDQLISAAHEKNILIGFDCCHSVGAVPHEFNNWNLDFAVWCSYKYLNGGPGSPAFIYINKLHHSVVPNLRGWWGCQKENQFNMEYHFLPAPGVGKWQISSPHILSTAPLKGALSIIQEAGIYNIRKKSQSLTSYLVYLIEKYLEKDPYNFSIITPKDPNNRSSHIAIQHQTLAIQVNHALKKHGIIGDFRPPNIIRLAPIALYNTYFEVFSVVQTIKRIIDSNEYKQYSSQTNIVA